MLRTLLTRRWVITTLVLAALVPTFYRLGLWQYHRYQQTKASNQVTSANLNAAAVPMTSLARPGAVIPGNETYRTVTATGHYDRAHEFVVRQRTDSSGSTIGFYVVTPLVTGSGEAVLVNRGWVQPNNTSAAAYPAVPPAPSGTVTVTGRLRPDETYAGTGIHQRDGLPAHQYMIINSGEQAKNLPEPVVAGYLELTATSPTPPAADEAQLVPPPGTDTNSMAVVGKGVHLPYAIQWWIFAAAVPVAWWILLRRDAKEQQQTRADEASPAEPPRRTTPSPSGAAGE